MKSRNKLFYPTFPVKNVADLYYRKEALVQLGKGKFSKIYKLDESTVVKIMEKRDIIANKMIEQVKEEKDNLNLLNPHSGIIELLDGWQDDMCLYMTFPLSPVNLFSVVKKCTEGILPTEAVFSMIIQVGKAISSVHDLGIVHRDIKLENIMISPKDGLLKLSDFGLSKRLQRRQRTYTICGTLPYMSPEIACEKPYDHAVDWWSFGVLLHRAALGKLPFLKVSSHQELAKHFSQFEFIDFINTIQHSNKDIERLMKECFNPDPSHRIGSVTDIIQKSRFIFRISNDFDFLNLYNTMSKGTEAEKN